MGHSTVQPSLQRCCHVRCNRDHSIANNVTQQTGSFNVPGKRKVIVFKKCLGAGDAASAAKGVV